MLESDLGWLIRRATFSNGCWLWRGGKSKNGYGLVDHQGRKRTVHRVALELTGVQIRGKVVRHSCDVKLCFRPEHLLAGTYSDNMRDALERGQAPTGERCSWSRLTEAHVREIRRRVANGEKQRHLAKEFGVSPMTLHYVARGKTWRWLNG